MIKIYQSLPKNRGKSRHPVELQRLGGGERGADE